MPHLDGLDVRCIKDFLKFIILDLLNENAQQGFTITMEIHNRYMILISPNTIYRLLNDMMDDELIESKKKSYYITERGREALKIFTEKLGDLNLTFESENLVDK
ncbi:MAG: PadR family transcriptional regulator [archaeon]|nr:PadR family transcriptional regulator [archaeon]MCP8314509.1 PadR family transcriptional regulator [archaeon]MCP8319910.1 PadR family transcriptional regulator [archaeon]